MALLMRASPTRPTCASPPMQDGTPPLSMNFYGVCVDSCPGALEFVCNYATQAVLDTAFPGKGAGRAAGAYAAKLSPQWVEQMRCQSELAARFTDSS